MSRLTTVRQERDYRRQTEGRGFCGDYEVCGDCDWFRSKDGHLTCCSNPVVHWGLADAGPDWPGCDYFTNGNADAKTG